MSSCRTMNTAAQSMDSRPMPSISSRAKGSSPAAATTPKNRSRARNAQLVTPPARSAPITPGDSP